MSGPIKKVFSLIPPALLVLFTFVSSVMLVLFVDLKPKVEQNFFFADDDPQLETDRQIAAIFEEPEQLLISAKGDIRSPAYAEKVTHLTRDLQTIKEIIGVQSLAEGPEKPSSAFDSELWKRVLISDDKRSTNILMFLEDSPTEVIIPKIEKVVERHDSRDFKLIVAGAPYVVELIRRNLVRDFQIFTLAALAIFAVVMFLIFRSVVILVGTFIACLNASMITLFLNQWLKIKMGPLTANLSTIVFVLTLSHIAYITFNWKHLVEKSGKPEGQVWKAVTMTLPPSFWSMLTTFLGFLSLAFVPAVPLSRLGIAGSIGTLTSLVIAYFIYPWFLNLKAVLSRTKEKKDDSRRKSIPFLRESHVALSLLIVLVVGWIALSIGKINSDPSLLLYFKEGGKIREQLDYVDKNGGTSGLKIVVKNPDGSRLDTPESYEKLWALQRDLEDYYPVGRLISLPLIMMEGKARIPFSSFMSWEWIVKILFSEEAGGVAEYFIEPERKLGLYVLMMKEALRLEPRIVIVNEIERMVKEKGLDVHLLGGMYLMQGKLSSLVVRSLFLGLALLLGLFILMGYGLSRSIRTTIALSISLVLIPLWVLGAIGKLQIPLDIISAPSTNIAIAMGVDAMIHMIIAVRRAQAAGESSWVAWGMGRELLWRPILSSVALVAAGFSIFCFSQFPPTQRFGFDIVVGTVMAPLATLIVLPTLAASRSKKA